MAAAVHGRAFRNPDSGPVAFVREPYTEIIRTLSSLYIARTDE